MPLSDSLFHISHFLSAGEVVVNERVYIKKEPPEKIGRALIKNH